MPLLSLPPELFHQIISTLSNCDIKSLRLTCRRLCDVARLRLSRVFLSANPLNIRVFRTVAEHPLFRQQVTEIVWDDAFLIDDPTPEPDPYNVDAVIGSDDEEEVNNNCPKWFVTRCKNNLDELSVRMDRNEDGWYNVERAAQQDARPSLWTCWQYYQNLLAQQAEVLIRQSDVEALVYGLRRFPALERITITPAAHGWLYQPLYETPMIRAFPKGFNYPIPHGWPTAEEGDPTPEAEDWGTLPENVKEQWRGVRLVLRALAQHPDHRVVELILDVNQLDTGLNCTIFHQPCEEVENLVALLRRPGFRRLDLPLIVRGQEYEEWPAFRNGNLRRALGEAPSLEHLSLYTTIEVDSRSSRFHFTSLQTIFPVAGWSGLQTLKLSRFIVIQDDVISLLEQLSTLQVIELSFLGFLDNGGNYRDLLDEIRERFRWSERDPESRPKLIVAVAPWPPRPGLGIWLEEEVHSFLYDHGRNPFSIFRDAPNQVPQGTGTLRDSFEPGHERPYFGSCKFLSTAGIENRRNTRVFRELYDYVRGENWNDYRDSYETQAYHFFGGLEHKTHPEVKYW
ncbi:uncharacterized protein BO72DRAFT_428617 [Aspergillus fijiensis CBS 313.89]|uniref:F-box domain-containing protein n=1 Tax=Aspergillus fijiensis CBS 313.89 TaxID=1448319 RepID=A0A8G1RNN4_9EURO|nr:uncharacterized protein BO72DRAFT_428617 [Aspergillus fijiensis CBS 313.89]RAK77392.1 hypothetical protein BO72DRAFT_428617 [Aspergillus fijiensis CBS 313.89]